VFVPDETNVRNDVSMKQFLDADADATELLYWTGDLRDTTPALVSALGIWSSLMIKDDLGTATDDSIHIPMLWCSSPTVAAQTHHDKSHNVFVQVSGTKDILLLPPSAVKLISAYPSVHAGKKMSQMPFEEEYDKVVARFPNVTQLVDSKTAQKVTLKAGEALYIPPYWYHSITSNDEVAVSLSVVSPSWEEALVGRVGYTPLPIGGVEGRVERMMAVQVKSAPHAPHAPHARPRHTLHTRHRRHRRHTRNKLLKTRAARSYRPQSRSSFANVPTPSRFSLILPASPLTNLP